jgi:hypothetical protein
MNVLDDLVRSARTVRPVTQRGGGTLLFAYFAPKFAAAAFVALLCSALLLVSCATSSSTGASVARRSNSALHEELQRYAACEELLSRGGLEARGDVYVSCLQSAVSVSQQLRMAAYLSMHDCSIARDWYEPNILLRAGRIFREGAGWLPARLRWESQIWMAPVASCVGISLVASPVPARDFLEVRSAPPIYSEPGGWQLPAVAQTYPPLEVERGALGAFERDDAAVAVFRAQALYCLARHVEAPWPIESRALIETLPAALFSRNLVPSLCER